MPAWEKAKLKEERPPRQLTSLFHCGDRVKAKFPIQISQEGRGYFNEGAGEGVPPHQRDEEEDEAELAELEKVIEGGSEGTVVEILPPGEWANKPKGCWGTHRFLVMINWDDTSYPMDMVEENDLEKTDGSLGDRLCAQKREKNKAEKAR